MPNGTFHKYNCFYYLYIRLKGRTYKQEVEK